MQAEVGSKRGAIEMALVFHTRVRGGGEGQKRGRRGEKCNETRREGTTQRQKTAVGDLPATFSVCGHRRVHRTPGREQPRAIV